MKKLSVLVIVLMGAGMMFSGFVAIAEAKMVEHVIEVYTTVGDPDNPPQKGEPVPPLANCPLKALESLGGDEPFEPAEWIAKPNASDGNGRAIFKFLELEEKSTMSDIVVFEASPKGIDPYTKKPFEVQRNVVQLGQPNPKQCGFAYGFPQIPPRK